MRYLVTGAQGFVGRYFVAATLADDPEAEVLGIGRSPRRDEVFTHNVRFGATSVPAPLPVSLREAAVDKRYRYEAIDICDGHSLVHFMLEFRPELVVHLASGLRDDDNAHLMKTNLIGTITLIEAIAELGPTVRMSVLGSTGGVYGAPERIPIQESALCRPVDAYSTSKLVSEHASRIVAERYGVPVLWARLFNLVGPGQDERHVCGRFAAQAAAIARGVAEPVVEAGNLDSTRDFVDVRDVASALGRLAHSGVAGEAYNVSSGVEVAIGDVLASTLRAAGIEGSVSIARAAPRVNDIARHTGDPSKITSLGYTPRYTLAKSIGDVVGYYMTEAAAAVS
ncbi:MAG TPA: NAD-dependent epimerase/dehydratase family protein [Candidatus Eremiobacteraceae bacterium]|nr:NAD-dependent epimerase/dehydratase family protein [Candidatus Eremiobacteraceae bacterium]